MNIYRNLLIGIALLLAAHAKNTWGMQGSDDYYRKMLSGVWANKAERTNDIWGYDVYFPDGTMHSFGFMESELGLEKKTYVDMWLQWKIVNGKSCITVVKSSIPEAMPVGYSWCDIIKRINEREAVFKTEEGETVLYKIGDHKI